MTKHALVVYGGWEGHTPKACAELFAPFLEDNGFTVTLANSLDAFLDEGLMAKVSLIVPIWTMGEMSDKQWQSLDQAVKRGVGVAGFHGGIIDAFRNHTGYQWMTGGQWVAHPGDIVKNYSVQIRDHEHPITRDIDDFELCNTEQYYMHVDPSNHVLATTTFTGEFGCTEFYQAPVVMPYAWTRQWHQGRIFVAAWGHTVDDFNCQPALEIVQRGLLWAASK